MHEGPGIRLRFENDKNQRYYEVHLQKDLFNLWSVTRVWGRKRSALGQVRHMPHETYLSAIQDIDTVIRQRRNKGYKLQQYI